MVFIECYLYLMLGIMHVARQYIRTGIKVKVRGVEGELWIRVRKKNGKVHYECYLYVGFGRKLIPVSCMDIESEYAIDIEKLVKKHVQD